MVTSQPFVGSPAQGQESMWATNAVHDNTSVGFLLKHFSSVYPMELNIHAGASTSTTTDHPQHNDHQERTSPHKLEEIGRASAKCSSPWSNLRCACCASALQRIGESSNLSHGSTASPFRKKSVTRPQHQQCSSSSKL